MRPRRLLLPALAVLAALAACRSTSGNPVGGSGGTGACGGVECGGDQFCLTLPCGEGLPMCLLKPTSCPSGGPQVCGDDGVVYDSKCEAAKAGHSEGTGCTAPAGLFACGSSFCDPQSEFCQTMESTCGAPTSQCQPFPNGCELPPDCTCLGGNVACVTGDTADSTCSATGNEITVYCPQ